MFRVEEEGFARRLPPVIFGREGSRWGVGGVGTAVRVSAPREGERAVISGREVVVEGGEERAEGGGWSGIQTMFGRRGEVRGR